VTDTDNHVQVKIHLSNGDTLYATLTEGVPEDTDLEEVTESLLNSLLGLERPQFVSFDNIIVHTQAISGLELDIINS